MSTPIPPSPQAGISILRAMFHAQLKDSCFWLDPTGVATNVDKHSDTGKLIGNQLARILGARSDGRARLAGQEAGRLFEDAARLFVDQSFRRLAHIRPGTWQVLRHSNTRGLGITAYQQYEHLADVAAAAGRDRSLAASIGTSYEITPDLVVLRAPEPDETINAVEVLVDDSVANRTGLRRANEASQILHAVISCKWTVRSDRVQNARSEALNLIRNRKGRAPHITVLTAEPLPSRLMSIALGTGDIDCVYHFALPELIQAVSELEADGQRMDEALYSIDVLIGGKRLRDISDLPFDLAI